VAVFEIEFEFETLDLLFDTADFPTIKDSAFSGFGTCLEMNFLKF